MTHQPDEKIVRDALNLTLRYYPHSQFAASAKEGLAALDRMTAPVRSVEQDMEDLAYLATLRKPVAVTGEHDLNAALEEIEYTISDIFHNMSLPSTQSWNLGKWRDYAVEHLMPKIKALAAKETSARFTIWKNKDGTYGVSPTYAPDILGVEKIWFIPERKGTSVGDVQRLREIIYKLTDESINECCGESPDTGIYDLDSGNIQAITGKVFDKVIERNLLNIRAGE